MKSNEENQIFLNIGPAGLCFVAVFIISIALVLTKKWHGAISMDLNEGIQKFHSAPTPRIGGIAIVLGLILASSMSSSGINNLLSQLLIAGFPAFAFGLAEDLTKRVDIYKRLLATFSSGLLVCWISGYSLSRIDIWGLNALLQITLISILFTSFALSGIANSINIIDGFNGLSSITCTIAFVGIGLIGYKVGDINLSNFAFILAASTFGFFLINWPFGKIFLGDGGAYFIGFSLAWAAVLLVERNKSVSAFSVVMICILPITEVLFSIYRRIIRKSHPGEPDRLHFHSLLHRRYISRWLKDWSDLAKNSVVGLLVGSMSIIPTILAIIFFESTMLCSITAAFFSLSYIIIYLRMIKHNWL